MREIKFRGRNYDGIWMYGYLIPTPKPQIHLDNEHCVCECPQVISKVDIVHYEVEENTIGQYTGLKDKNGKEIYEGDILRSNEYPFNCDGVDNYYAEIVWVDNVCGFYRVTHKKPNSTVSGISHGNCSPLVEEDIESFEIIGNIHDNPKLIKEE